MFQPSVVKSENLHFSTIALNGDRSSLKICARISVAEENYNIGWQIHILLSSSSRLQGEEVIGVLRPRRCTTFTFYSLHFCKVGRRRCRWLSNPRQEKEDEYELSSCVLAAVVGFEYVKFKRQLCCDKGD